ncbi:MAG: Uma2 family endonuclease [Myxococcota bacterium]
MEPASKRATYEDFAGLDESVRAEVLAGTITALPAPLPEHGRAQRALGRYIGGPFDDHDGRGGPGGWWILLEGDVRFEPHVVVRPDLAGWRRERLSSPWGMRPIDVVPDWICEIVSPSNVGHDRVTKANAYLKYGVTHSWIVDPLARVLEAFERSEEADGTHWKRLGGWIAGVARLAPFEAVALEVERVFPPVSA